MYDESKEFSLARLTNAARKYKKSAITAGLIVMSTVVFGNKILIPDTYEASALVRVKTTLNEDPRIDRVSVIQEEILSRSVLSKVVNDLHLTDVSNTSPSWFQRFMASIGVNIQPRAPSVDSIARGIAKDTIVYEAQTSGQSDTFIVSLTGENPEEISNIVNAIVITYIANRTTLKSGESERTAEFLQLQLTQKGKELEVVSRKIDAYRTANAGLVSRSDSIASSLQQTRMNLIMAQSRLAESNARVNDLTVSLQNEPQTILSSVPSSSQNPATMSPLERLARLRNDLEVYRAKYTHEHPDIVRTEREIENLQRIVATASTSDRPVIRNGSPNPEYQRLRNDLSAAKAARQSALSEISQLKKEMGRLETQMSKLPAVQQIMDTLTTRQTEVRGEYERLKQQLAQAQIASAASATSVGTNFSVIDPAVAPTTPQITSRLVFHIIGIILGIITGVVVTFVRELFSTDADGSTVQTSPASDIMFYVGAVVVLVFNISYIAFELVKQQYVVV